MGRKKELPEGMSIIQSEERNSYIFTYETYDTVIHWDQPAGEDGEHPSTDRPCTIQIENWEEKVCLTFISVDGIQELHLTTDQYSGLMLAMGVRGCPQ